MGVPCRSPHELRHGRAVFALKRARTIGGLESVGQNLMPPDLTITNPGHKAVAVRTVTARGVDVWMEL